VRIFFIFTATYFFLNKKQNTQMISVKIYSIILLISLGFWPMTSTAFSVVPKPHQQKLRRGSCNLNRRIEVLVIGGTTTLQFERSYLSTYLNSHNAKIGVANRDSLKVYLQIDKKFENKPNYHELKIESNKILISGGSAEAVFHGANTLAQMVLTWNGKDYLRCGNTQDAPKFSWRGMHLDVCRHFFSTKFIKKYIDLLAFYKMNVFHWHLTEDQGWRIEIKKYPKLTSVGAWRSGTMIGAYDNQEFDSLLYGGFYSQEQIKEIVRYAADRHITVVPEIELPGHALAALSAYPEYSCTGGPFQVARGWGVFDDVFCAKEETFQFLEDVLSEVIELFPSAYIHIGGDESPKVRWKTCPNCQNTIKQNGLKDEHELQSYFIRRIEKFLNSKGRKLIGWDEILEGGLAPDATVMSWRGTEGGIAAAKMQHNVVMTPGSHCYFDHYQGNPRYEPHAIGGYTTLEKVYGFNPIPSDLSKKEALYILGAQGNVWTEYMKTEQQVEYMLLPRLLALSEVLWGTSNSEKYDDFLSRVEQHMTHIFKILGYNYSKAIYEVELKVEIENGQLFVRLVSPLIKKLHYSFEQTISQTTPIYETRLPITKSTSLRFGHFFDGKMNDVLAYEQKFIVNKATAKKISLEHAPHENYAHGGSNTLVDGIQAAAGYFGKDWLGFSGKDLIATIDLGTNEPISNVGVNFLQRPGSWIYFPSMVLFEVSNDGQNFVQVGQASAQIINKMNGRVRIPLISSKVVRFVRITASNYGTIKDGEPGAGSKAWLFTDEIVVD